MNARQRRKAFRAWRARAIAHSFPWGPVPVVEIPRRELDRLPEYSLSTPTGAQPGRRWKANLVELHRFGRRRLPFARPRWVHECWFVAEVLPEPHGEGGHKIRYSLARVTG